MYVLPNANVSKAIQYSEYKNNDPLYQQGIDASYALSNRDISILDLYKPNSITSINYLINDIKPTVLPLSKYIYDETNNANGCIKVDATTANLVNSYNNSYPLFVHLSSNKTLDNNTFNPRSNVILLIPNNYYLFISNYNFIEIGSKPSNISIEGNTNTSSKNWIVGNISNDILNKIISGNLDKEIILTTPESFTVSNDKSNVINSYYFICNSDNFTRLNVLVNERETSFSEISNTFIRYFNYTFNQTSIIKIRDEEEVLKTITITLE